MIKKIVIGVCGLVFVAALSFPAFADQSIGFRQYFKEGVKAFKEDDDQEALRCFKIAQIYDPSDAQLNRYLSILEQRGVILELHLSQLPPEKSIGYRYYLSKGVEAFRKRDYKKAIYDFNIAIIFYPDSKEANWYLQILGRPLPQPQAIASSPGVKSPNTIDIEELSASVIASKAKQSFKMATSPEAQVVPQPQAAVSSVQPQEPQQAAVIPQPPPVISQGAIYVTAPKAKMPVAEISLSQISNNGQLNPKLQIELNSSVILDGKDIRRFLVVNEGFVTVKSIDADRLEMDAQKIGNTFLHIWDNYGRHTFYVEVVFPKSVNPSNMSQAVSGVQHGEPFKVVYTNDWDTEYSGKNISDIKRQSYNFNQTLTVTGETPYGFFDTSGSYTDTDSISSFDYYTIGLSQIPLEGTSNFNLRGFDATRYLSPLTMPSTGLRGAFADVDLMGDVLGLSVSHGQEQETLGFISLGQQTQVTNSYIDAVKLTLFPKSNSDQYSFNFATAYGPDQPKYLADHVYSVEGLHRFNDYLTLNAEQATDSRDNAELASLKWQDGNFRSGLNFRNVDKNYTTVSSLPQYQGETEADWTTESHFKNIMESTFVEAYRDRIDSNPDNPSALNYDANGQLRVEITKNFWSDSNFNYMDNAGEASPTSSLGLNERLSRSFGIWNSLQGTVFGGVGYQDSHSMNMNLYNYNRENVIGGFQLPLTRQLSFNSSYEYDWIDQPHSGGNSNAGIINAGLGYQKQITQKLSFNSSVNFHDELGVKANNNSFFSGEENVNVMAGLNYSPTPDMSIFGDCVASQDLYHTGNPSLEDIGIHVGMRITFGGATYWDPLGTVYGIVFKDRNGDGKFVSGDEGIPGVKVKVGDKVAITDKYGHYSIQIRAKSVDVVPVLDTVPGGLLFSTPQSLHVPVFQGRKSKADFGLISQTGIFGLVFVSKHGTNVPNEGDRFIGKVEVVLDGKIIQKSDSNGAFYFRKATPGEHTISININSIPLNMVPLVKLQNKIDVGEGINYPFNIPLQIKEAEGEEN